MIEWSTHHKDDPPVDDENRDNRSDDIDPWDQEFLKAVDQGTLFQLLLVSDRRDVYGRRALWDLLLSRLNLLYSMHK